ncbi:MAG: hypothetical protein L3J38_05980, partial [Thiomicrorhabdus sp.]|nr:hypothetical protein [Thiomicrorhabdus sp.]
MSDPQNEFAGLNIFYIDEDARDKALSPQQVKWLQSAKKKLNAERRLRPRPHLDDKIITAWNGMMITALAKAAKTFEHPEFLFETEQTARFIKAHLSDKKTGKLFRQHRENVSSTEAALVDYVWLIQGLLAINDAGEVTPGVNKPGVHKVAKNKAAKNKQWLDWAFALQKKQDELFLDKSSGAYFESTADDTNILFRSKSIYDGALPSANSIALSNLRQLSRLTHD